MPRRTFPTLLPRNVASHNDAKSCYVTVGNKVYDITPFLDDHPGGGDLILEYGGKDVSEIMVDGLSHLHSESAYDILDKHLIGFIVHNRIMTAKYNYETTVPIVPLPLKKSDRSGMAELERLDELMIERDVHAEFMMHRFLDLNKPLILQL